MDNNTTEPSSLYFFNNSEDIKKAEKKLNNAKAAYANIGANEEVLFLFDDTVFGSAKEGFVVTSSSIYSHTINKDGISFADIDKLYLANPIDRKIMIRGKDGSDSFIKFSTQMDKEIPPYFNILSKYLSMLNMINSLGKHDIAEDIVIENAFKVIENSADGTTNEELIKAFKGGLNTSNSQESKPLNSKTAYSEKIASGEIDPTEVSFAEFDKNFIKENSKKIYSEKIASGEIDPTEVSFADFADSMQSKEDSSKPNSEKTLLSSGDMTVRYIEFFRTGEQPNTGKGDWEDSFSLPNYFIRELSIVSYDDDEILTVNGELMADWDVYLETIEKNAEGIIQLQGENLSARFLLGMINSARGGENDQEAVYEILNDMDADLDFFNDTDDLPEQYGNSFGCRIWEVYIEGLSIYLEDGNITETLEGHPDGVSDYFYANEGDVEKKIAVINVAIS
jgi:hypothetical protein